MKKINFNDYFFMGLFLIGLAFYFFTPILFTPKSALLERTGKVEKIKIDYNWVKAYRGGTSVRCELKIFLERDKNKYSIFENIGQSTFHSKFEKIKSKLRPNQLAKIWIRKSEKSSSEPNIFQIANEEDEILYDIKDAKSLSKFGFIGAFGLGFIFILLSFKKKN